MEGEWYRGAQFSGGRMVMLQRWSLMEGEWCYRSDHNGGKMVMLQRWSLTSNNHVTEVVSLLEIE